jgi:FixJ family two-component response regulator
MEGRVKGRNGNAAVSVIIELYPFRRVRAIGQAIERSHSSLRREAQTRSLRDRYASLSPREREVMRKMYADSLAELVNMAARLGLGT